MNRRELLGLIAGTGVATTGLEHLCCGAFVALRDASLATSNRVWTPSDSTTLTKSLLRLRQLSMLVSACCIFLVIPATISADPPSDSSLSTDGEVLYNGIRLPKTWPPTVEKLPDHPVLPPYLASPPAVIPIDVGRQLFVDDFLIHQTTLRRTYHRPEFYKDNPILTPEKPWERTGAAPRATTHSGGVCFDPTDQLFKMWYMTGLQQGVGLVISKDGLNWERPKFDHVQKGTNLVYDSGSRGSTIWHHMNAEDAARRFVMFTSRPGYAWFSPDGIHWGKPFKVSGPLSDRTTLFWNPFRKVWVYSIKTAYDKKRARRYWETPQLTGHPRSRWRSVEEPTLWTGADSADPPLEDLQVPCQLYNLDCVAYESILLGTFIIWRGDYRFDSKTEAAKQQQQLGRPKQNSACIGFSRDGFHWHRPDRREFLPKSETPGAWNWGNSQTAGKSPLIVGNKLYFYVTGKGGPRVDFGSRYYRHGSTGVAMLRRDGFASMDAGSEEGTLTTRLVKFGGKHLYVNINNPRGRLRVEVVDEKGQPIEPFTLSNCIPITADRTLYPVEWKGVSDLSTLSSTPVRFRFYLSAGELYSFWVSLHRSGASYGYVAGGGPGFTGNRDTIGNRYPDTNFE
jgi:hypothetical protein